jgi:hypothetical protein
MDDDDVPRGGSAARVQAVQRRLSVVVPEPFFANEEAQVYVGLDDGLPTGSTEIILRVTALHATPAQQQGTLKVGNGAAYTTFKVRAGEYNQLRLRIEALQADEYSGDISKVGGLYVDVDVTNNPNESGQLAAFGIDVTVSP